MAKLTPGNFKTDLVTLIKRIKKEPLSSNYFVFSQEKSVFDNIIKEIGSKFADGNFDYKNNFSKYYSEDTNLEMLINECSNASFFSEKKIVYYKLSKKTGTKGGLKADDKKALINYLNNPNPETILVIAVRDKEYLIDSYSEYFVKNTGVFIINNPDEDELTEWINTNKGEYSIDKDAVKVLLQHINPSYDESFQELEKLKLYCYETKTIDIKAVHLCIGMSREYNENDFINAILDRRPDTAMLIYDNLALREDSDILLIYMIGSLFQGIFKLGDPGFKNINEYEQKRELKIFYDKNNTILNKYKKFRSETNELKIKNSFDYIYKTDKALKTSSTDKRTLFSTLITEVLK